MKKTHELLQVSDKEVGDIVAGQVVEDLCQKVEGLKENLQLRTVLCIGLDHGIRCQKHLAIGLAEALQCNLDLGEKVVGRVQWTPST